MHTKWIISRFRKNKKGEIESYDLHKECDSEYEALGYYMRALKSAQKKDYIMKKKVWYERKESSEILYNHKEPLKEKYIPLDQAFKVNGYIIYSSWNRIEVVIEEKQVEFRNVTFNDLIVREFSNPGNGFLEQDIINKKTGEILMISQYNLAPEHL